MELITEIVSSDFTWAILCIAVVAIVLREMRKENVTREKRILALYDIQSHDSKEREADLMNQLRNTTQTQKEITKQLEHVGKTLDNMENRIDRIEKYYFKDLKGGDK